MKLILRDFEYSRTFAGRKGTHRVATNQLFSIVLMLLILGVPVVRQEEDDE